MTLDFQKVQRHFRKVDPVIARLIKAAGPFSLRPQKDRFGMLARSILSQQISTSAATSIRKRLEALLAPRGIVPDALVDLDAAQLRVAGVSPQKAGYLLDLARRANDGSLRLRRVGRLSDEEVIQELVQVKGIGRWTAQMFLIFSLGRLDVFPPDDLGIRTALRNLYGLADLPTREQSQAIAAPWSPYATIATWYCWRSLDLAKAARLAAKTCA